jgi:hypothetical protein
MISKTLLFQKIESEVSHLRIDYCCKEIVELILSSSERKPVFSYSDFMSVVDGECSIEQVQLCLNFLKSASVKLIEQQYRYVDEDVIYDVSVEDLQAAFMNGSLSIEDRGYPDRDYQSKVYIVFVADKAVIEE